MTDACTKCKRPYAQGLLIVPDPWTYCDDPVVCDTIAAAYQRGLEAGRAERPDISPEDAAVYLRGPVRAAAGDAWFRANDAMRSALEAHAAKVKR